MPKIGDGTGEGSQPPTKDGLTANQDAKPESSSGDYGQGSGGKGGQKYPHGNRMSPLSSGSGISGAEKNKG